MRVEGVGTTLRVNAAPNVGRNIPNETGEVVKPQSSEQEGSWGSSAKNPSQMTQAEKNALPISEKAMLEAIEKANKSVSGADTRFEFSIHEKTKQIMVKVIDEESNEIIRQIPPEKILDMIAGIWDVVGLFVDEKR